MIVTLTPNPSVDRTLVLPTLRRGAVNRAESSSVEPSGKGVNVARALSASGVPTVAVLPLGEAGRDPLAGLLAGAGLDVVGVPIDQPVRVNVTLLEPGGVSTKVNEPGPPLSDADAEALLAATERTVRDARQEAHGDPVWAVCCGSLPPGVPAGIYAEVVQRVHRLGGRVAVDSSGEPLRLAAEAGADLVAPNAAELAGVVGGRLTTVGDVVDAAATLRRHGAGSVLVSLGPDGAVLAGTRTWHGEAPPVDVVSTVGAGDALLAGFLAGGAEGVTGLRTGLLWAAACCRSPGSRFDPPGTDTGTGVSADTGAGTGNGTGTGTGTSGGTGEGPVIRHDLERRRRLNHPTRTGGP